MYLVGTVLSIKVPLSPGSCQAPAQLGWLGRVSPQETYQASPQVVHPQEGEPQAGEEGKVG